uniref:Putative secreted peptide n=1 Tax=Rhipicephalus pulchellus TaxID=72859 RepID=L7MC22_RHIPC
MYKDKMWYVPQSCAGLFLGVFLLQIIAHHNGNATPALNIKQRNEPQIPNVGDYEVLGEGDECEMTEYCNSTLCCLDTGSGTKKCQQRPVQVGQNCSATFWLTPDGDEGPYWSACPCGGGLVCNVTQEQSVQQSQEASTDGDADNHKLGTCIFNRTVAKPIESR